MNSSRRVTRIGRLGPWHRKASYAVLGACALSGLGWFVLLDAFHREPPEVVTWWILHGLTGLLALLVVGSVLATHVPVAWRHHRNRALGGLTLGIFVLVLGSTGALLYGKEAWHTPSHWLHVGAGLVGVVVFALHVWLGPRSSGKAAAAR